MFENFKEAYCTLSDQFNFKYCTIAGDECVLITPLDMGVAWNDQNKIFRSSIWRTEDMKPVSLGFKKFTNLGESPDFEPWNENEVFSTIKKIDGSLLIVSMYKGELIVRTRGTVDARVLDNGYEIEILKQKYPKVFDNRWLKEERHSFLYEWTTPTNRIVLRESDTPELTLIGMVRHSGYRYITQRSLNTVAKELEVKRPEVFTEWNNIEGIREFLKTNKNIEGFVIYSLDGQTLKKLKTEHYLYLHRVFTGIKTIDNLFDLWKESDYLFYYDFKEWLVEKYDHELAVSLEDLIQKLFVIRDTLAVVYKGIWEFVNVEKFKSLTRKEQAQEILKNWSIWSPIAFDALDGKNLDWEKMYKLYKKYGNV